MFTLRGVRPSVMALVGMIPTEWQHDKFHYLTASRPDKNVLIVPFSASLR
ncbi:MAG: hypothetical protein WDZ91_02370 [Paenibacillaceae bacterium]